MGGTLVAYFSATGTTKSVAGRLAEAVNADVLEIRPEVPYTSADLDWTNARSRSSVEMNDLSGRPALADAETDVSAYDTILLGFPIWWGRAPTIVNTFLESHDLDGKRIVLFATSGGSGMGRTADGLRASVPQSCTIVDGGILNGRDSVRALREWADGVLRRNGGEAWNLERIIQTAGRDSLGEFAPEFAHFNDDVLFGEDWNNRDIDHKTRCIVTVVALMSSGVTDSSLAFHLENAKKAGVTRKEIAAVITHAAFYVGWPKAWAAFGMAKGIWTEDSGSADAKAAHAAEMMFPIGEPNEAYARYFIGRSYIAPVSTGQISIANVTFEPGCRNNWHIHRSDRGGGQILICVAGRGYCQEWGEDPVEMRPGDCVNIPAGVKHWHGAAPDSWFSHLAIEVPGENASNEWLEPVDDDRYRFRFPFPRT